MLKHFFRYLMTTTVLLLMAPILGMADGYSTIVEYLEQKSDGNVTVVQPMELNERLKPENGDTTNVGMKHFVSKELVGYRIQVFSDKNQRTAKNEALSKERSIKESFPELGTYITYNAPSWRLRVGDFRTREEAAAVLDILKEAFPGYASEMIVVVDRINASAL